MGPMRRALILSLLALATCATAAQAHSQAVIGLGLGISTYDPTGHLGLSSTDFGPLIHVKTGTGLGPTIGFDWYTVGVLAMAGNQPVDVGRLRVRPIMAGAAYDWNRRKYWLSVSMVGGHAFAALTDVNDRSRPLLRSALGGSSLTLEAVDSFVWRPQFALWYDAAPRVGITASIAY